MSGAKVDDVRKRIIELNEVYNIRKMILHVGGNNIPQEDPVTLTESICNLLQSTKSLMPSTELFYSAIIPRIGDNFLPGLNSVNRNIRSFCTENSVKFISHFQFYLDSERINFKFFINDKVHPTREGSTILAKNMIAAYRNYNMDSSGSR